MNKISDNHLVEKSKSIVWAKFKDYTAGELRLLEVYLSRINPRDPESSLVKFTFSEYREFLGLKKLDVRNIKPQIRHFLGNVVFVPIDKEKGTFNAYTLFTSASVDLDPETNSYVITIGCNELLRPVFFNIAESGYVKYRLRYTAQMKSQYSIQLYAILRDWLTGGKNPHEISLRKLREQLGVAENVYPSYKDFKKRVLLVSQKEINEVSDLTVDFEPVLVARKAVGISFWIKLKNQEVLKEADFKDVSGQEGNNPTESEKPVRKPRSAPYEDVDWGSIAPELERAACISIAKMVAKRLKAEYPQVKQSKRKAAVVDTVRNAYDAVLANREPFPDNPAGYLYKVLDKEDVVGTYLPGKYTFE